MKTLIKNVYALLPDGTTPLTNIMIDQDKITAIGDVPEDFHAGKIIDCSTDRKFTNISSRKECR